jgi:hypothetical protein
MMQAAVVVLFEALQLHEDCTNLWQAWCYIGTANNVLSLYSLRVTQYHSAVYISMHQ